MRDRRPTSVHTRSVSLALALAVAGCGSTAGEPVDQVEQGVGGTLCSAATLTVDPPSGEPSNVKLTAAATCGPAPVEYRFFVRKPGATASEPLHVGYRPDPAFSWNASGRPAGRYVFTVWVRPAGSGVSWDASATVVHFREDVCSSVTLARMPAVTGLTPVAASARCTGSATPEYRFLVKGPGEAAYTPVASWGTRNDFGLGDAAPSGRYELMVYARARGNASDLESSAKLSVPVGQTCPSAALSVRPVGGELVLDAESLCGFGPEYRFLVRAPGATGFTELRPYFWDSRLYFTLPAGQPGRYEFQVQVRAQGNASDYEGTAKASALVGPSCNAATLRTGANGAFVWLEASATCTPLGEPPEYRFLVRPPGAAAFTALQPYGPHPVLPLLPAPEAPGRYEFQVQVRRAGNTTDSEASATTSALFGQSCASTSLAATYDAPTHRFLLSATGQCTPGATPLHRFTVREPGSASAMEVAPWGTGASAVVPLGTGAPGRYEFQVFTRAAGNASAWESTARATVTLEPTCAQATLAVATQPGSSLIDLEAGATCTPASTTPEYRFLVRLPGASTYLELGPYGTFPHAVFPGMFGDGRYDFQVQVRAVGSASDHDAVASGSALSGRTCSSAALTAASTGTGAELFADASCADAAPEYRFLVRPPGSSAFVEARGYGPEAGFSYVAFFPPVPGRYEFQVQARGAGNASGYEATGKATAFLGPSCSSAALDLAASGAVAELSASATCAPGTPAEYRYLVKRPGTSTFAELRPWGADPTLAFQADPAEAGRYEFQVDVRAAGNASPYEASAKAGALLGSTCGSATLAVETPYGPYFADVHATATCAEGTPEYRFMIRRPGAPAFSELRPWGTEAAFQFVPDWYAEKSGRYEFQVHVRAAGNASVSEAAAGATTLLGPGPVCPSATLAATSDGLSTVLLEADASSTAWGQPCEFRFLVRRPGATAFTELRGYGSEQYFMLPVEPAEFGRYEFQVQVRAAGNDSSWEATAKAVTLVGSTCSSATLAANPAGDSGVNLAATAACGPREAEYRFLVRRPGATSFTELRPYGVEGSFAATLQPPGAGRYEFQVQVRAAGNASDFEATARTGVLVSSTCSAATLTASGNAGGADLSATASCTAGSAEYRFLGRRPGTTTFKELRGYGPESSLSFQADPPASGRYEFQVQVRGAGNASDWEATARAAVLVGSTCSAATLAATPVSESAVELVATSTCAAQNPEYRFTMRRPGTTTLAELRDWHPDPFLPVWAELSGAGRYEFQVYVREQGNASDWEATARSVALVGPTCASVALSTTPTGFGEVELVASAACSEDAIAEYRFTMKRPGSGTFEELQGWSSGARVPVVAPWDGAGRYEFQVYARGAGNASESEATARTAALLGPTCSRATLLAMGEAATLRVDLEASASCTFDPPWPEYRFMARRPGATAWQELRGWDPDRHLSLGADWEGEGRWEFMVYVRYPGNASDYEASATITRAVGRTCSAAALSASTEPWGALRLDATSICDPGSSPEYRFMVKAPGATKFTELAPWSWWPVAGFTPATHGRYEFRVDVRSEGNASDYEATGLTAFVFGPSCPEATLEAEAWAYGEVYLTAGASCTDPWSAPPVYRFLVRGPGEPAFTPFAESLEPHGFFDPPPDYAHGKYEFRVDVRADGNPYVDSSANAAVLQGRACGSATLAVDREGPFLFQLDATATCTQWTTPEYRFLARRPGGSFVEVRPYAYSTRHTYDASALESAELEPGRYEFVVQVRAAGNASPHEASASAAVLAGPTCEAATISSTEGANRNVALAATASCTDGASPEYRFFVRRPDGASTEVRRYDPNPAATFLAGPAGRYELGVNVRAAGNASPSEASSWQTLLVGPTCGSVRLELFEEYGDYVAVNAIATCDGGAVPEYRFYVRPAGTTTWTLERPWGSEPVFGWDTWGLFPGTYEILVQARAAGNASRYESSATFRRVIGP
jgi:hypothetical protein